MPFLVTDSDSLLPAEALPALKLTEFYGALDRGTLYSYLQCYAFQRSLYYYFTVFDEAPPKEQRAIIALGSEQTTDYLALTLAPYDGETVLHLYREGDEPICTLPCIQADYLRGADEQGGYWRAGGIIPAEAFDLLGGSRLYAGQAVPGNVFLFHQGKLAFGAAFAVPKAQSVPTAKGFQPFVIVPY